MHFQELVSFIENSNRGIRPCCDSRDLRQGDCFVAIVGDMHDGHDFIALAAEAGASFIVSERHIETGRAEQVIVDNSRKAFAELCQAFYNRPSARLTNLAVTGTNGKTTVAYLVRHIINSSGRKCGMIGTVCSDTGKGELPAQLTTPDAMTIAALTDAMTCNGCDFSVVEASSHALVQDRLWGIDFKAAAFTNLSGDHLDYHKTIEQYLAAKMILFENLTADSTAVINMDSQYFGEVKAACKCDVLFYGIENQADIHADIIELNASGGRYVLSYNSRDVEVETSQKGRHNISNQLAAAGLCIGAGFSLEQIADALSSFRDVPGRLEAVMGSWPVTVLVDYAHTDDALFNVLSSLRAVCGARLIVVFGCGGDRDKTKRPRMAETAQKLADIVVVTSDNPRSENPRAIIDDIVKGFSDPGPERLIVEPDREKAISFAVETAERDDMILIAGKGHETYQLIGETKIAFDDRIVARRALEAKYGG